MRDVMAAQYGDKDFPFDSSLTTNSTEIRSKDAHFLGPIVSLVPTFIAKHSFQNPYWFGGNKSGDGISKLDQWI